MAAVETAPGFIRPDGKEKVTGTGRYTADLNLTGMAHAKFRYADHSHARILGIDTSKASALPGVVAIVTQDQLPDVRFGSFVQDRYLFAKDVVRFEGEIVAGVAALTPEIAAEAARLIEIHYEPLPAIADFEKSMEPGAPLIHPDLASYDKDDNIVANGNTMAYHTIVKGDADAAMATADVVVKGRYVSDASQGVPIEPRAVIAQWQGDKVTIWSSTQVPYAARAGVAQTLQVPEADVRVIVPLLGGGFGAKCDLHFEGQVAALARAAKRPVKLVFSREEEFRAIAQRREGIVMEFETGAMRDGRIVARKARLVLDKGAYCGEGGFLGQMAAMHACGPYIIDAIHVESYLNYTNNQPSGSVRAPTAPQVCWGLEQHMDEVARAIGMDPVELRRRTLIEEGAEGPTRQVFDKVGVRDTLETAVEMIGYDDADLPEDEAIGVATGWWPCMAGPSGAYIQMNGDGSATVAHRCTGERQRRRHGDAGVRRPGARDRSEGRLDPVPGHRRRAVGHGLLQLADDVQQRPRDPGCGGRGARAAARRRPPTSSRPTAATSSSPTAPRASRVRPTARSRSPTSSARSAPSTGRVPARCRRPRPATPAAASGASATRRSSRRSSSRRRPTSRSTVRRASSACCASPRHTTRAGSSTRPAPTARSTAAW